MRRLHHFPLSTLILSLTLASAATAAPPVTSTFGPTPPVDSRYCSFPVMRSDTGSSTTITKPDGTQISHISRTLTLTANGKTLTSNDHFTRFFDPQERRPFLSRRSAAILNLLSWPGYGTKPARSTP